MKRFFKYSFFVFLALLITFIGISYYYAKEFTAPNHCSIGDVPDSLKTKFQNIAFKTSDGLNIKGWYAKPDTGGNVIILLHSYKSNRMEQFPKSLMLGSNGYGVLLYDARGCGESGGDKISIGYWEQEDLLGAINFLKAEGIKNIGLIGFSQGGATIVLAGKRLPPEVKFAVIESTYPDLRNAINTRYEKHMKIPGWLGGMFMVPIAEYMLGIDVDEVSPYNNIKNIKISLLVITGNNDSRLDLKDAYSLFEIANEPKNWYAFPGAEHEDLYLFNKNDYVDVVMKFVKKYL